MRRTLCILLLLSGTAVLAQDKNPVTSVAREILPRQEKNLVAAVEKMPADKFAYKNNHLCSIIGDIPEVKAPAPLKESDGKEKLVAALKASFEFCSTALGKVDDSKLGDEVEIFGGHKGPRAFALFALTNDWADHYSSAAMYLRLNGLLPPTAQPKK